MRLKMFLQDVFIQVHRLLHSYDPARGAFSTWLYRITVNQCLNRRRRWTFFTEPLEESSAMNLASRINFGSRARRHRIGSQGDQPLEC